MYLSITQMFCNLSQECFVVFNVHFFTFIFIFNSKFCIFLWCLNFFQFQNSLDFCIFSLCPVNLQNSLTSSSFLLFMLILDPRESLFYIYQVVCE